MTIPKFRPSSKSSSAAHPLLLLLLPPLLVCTVLLDVASGHYQRSPCRRASATRRQFQLPDCRAPDLDVDLAIGEASFVMAHDAATGYLAEGAGGRRGRVDDDDLGDAFGGEYDGVDDMNGGGSKGSNGSSGGNGSGGNRWSGAIAMRLLSLYGKTQRGTAYDQLNDGARALDLRPKVYNNGTVGFHHGSLIDVPLRSITLGGLLDDVRRWCDDNPTELVLLFHSELAHESGYAGLSTGASYGDAGGEDGYAYAGIARMKAVYGGRGVPYLPCERLAGITVGEVMDMADLSKTGGGRGYLLAVDRHGMYGEFFAI